MLIPPLLGLVWWLDLWRSAAVGRFRGLAGGRGMIGFTAVMLLADWAVTGFAVLPLSRTAGGGHPSFEGRVARPAVGRDGCVTRAVETPIPQDWVGFATQLHHQRSGGPSYLLGERRMTGWWYYYFVALAVKVPLTFWVLSRVPRVALDRSRRRSRDRGWMLPTVIAAFLAVTAVGSSRNYGVRYLLPLAPLAIVWVSALAEKPGWPKAVVVGRTCRAGAGGGVGPPGRADVFQRARGRAGRRARACWPTRTSTGARGSVRSPGSSASGPSSAT